MPSYKLITTTIALIILPLVVLAQSKKELRSTIDSLQLNHKQEIRIIQSEHERTIKIQQKKFDTAIDSLKKLNLQLTKNKQLIDSLTNLVQKSKPEEESSSFWGCIDENSDVFAIKFTNFTKCEWRLQEYHAFDHQWVWKYSDEKQSLHKIVFLSGESGACGQTTFFAAKNNIEIVFCDWSLCMPYEEDDNTTNENESNYVITYIKNNKIAFNIAEGSKNSCENNSSPWTASNRTCYKDYNEIKSQYDYCVDFLLKKPTE